MRRYEIIYSPRALRQLAAIEQWIEGEAGTIVASRYREAIVAHSRKLQAFPHRGRARDDLRPGLRTLVFRRNVVIGYHVERGRVVIVGIARRGRDPATELT